MFPACARVCHLRFVTPRRPRSFCTRARARTQPAKPQADISDSALLQGWEGDRSTCSIAAQTHHRRHGAGFDPQGRRSAAERLRRATNPGYRWLTADACEIRSRAGPGDRSGAHHVRRQYRSKPVLPLESLADPPSAVEGTITALESKRPRAALALLLHPKGPGVYSGATGSMHRAVRPRSLPEALPQADQNGGTHANHARIGDAKRTPSHDSVSPGQGN